MKTLNTIAALSLSICLSPALHAGNERERVKPPHTDHAPQGMEKGFAELDRAMGDVRRQATQAARERDEALMALKQANARNAEMAARFEAMAKGRHHPDAPDRRPDAQQPQRDVRGGADQLRGEISSAMKDLAALREEIGKQREAVRSPGDAALIRKKFAELGEEKERAVSQLAEARKANEKLTQELKQASEAARRLSTEKAAVEKSLAETTAKLRMEAEKALKAQADRPGENRRGQQQRDDRRKEQ